MAKKTNRVSINALERFCKETTPDIMQRTFLSVMRLLHMR